MSQGGSRNPAVPEFETRTRLLVRPGGEYDAGLRRVLRVEGPRQEMGSLGERRMDEKGTQSETFQHGVAPEPSATLEPSSMVLDAHGRWVTADGRYWWNGTQWLATASELVARPPSSLRWLYRLTALGTLAVGWTVSLEIGGQLSGVAASIAAIATSIGAVLSLGPLLARKSGWMGHSRAAGSLGLAVAIAMAPIWVVRPFAGVAATVKGDSIASGAAVQWAATSVFVSALVGIWALALGGRLPARVLAEHANSRGGSLGTAAGTNRVPRGWTHELRGFVVVGLVVSLLGSAGSIARDQSDRRPGVNPTGALVAQASDFPAGLTNCSTQSIPDYMSGTRALGVPPTARPFEDSWRLMMKGGVIEGSVGLLVRASDECPRVVDTDPWVESFVFRFDSSDDALKSFHAGLFGIVPNPDPAKEPHNRLPETRLGWENDLMASWEDYTNDETQSQYTAFWPYSNYLVFYICRNVDPLGARPGTGGDYSLPPCATGALRIHDRIVAGLH